MDYRNDNLDEFNWYHLVHGRNHVKILLIPVAKKNRHDTNFN